MAKWAARAAAIFSCLLIVGTLGFFVILPPILDAKLNTTFPHAPYAVSGEAMRLQRATVVTDWHADTLLWNRDLTTRNYRGHADVPRLQEGGVGLQMFTVVSKSPSGQNFNRNTGDSDNITLLAIAQRWPVRSWDSLFFRAVYQAERLNEAVKKSPDLMWVRNKLELANYLSARATYFSDGGQAAAPIGALLGREGAHPLEGDIANLLPLYEAGVRMIGITHFFDNKLGGSLHGVSQTGLTDFGRQAVDEMDKRGIIIDLAHASEAVVSDVLDRVKRPVVISHTGFKGHTDTPRNISDALMKRIADAGGLLAVSFFAATVGNPPTPDAIADAVIYGIEQFGADHIALGSDWDGTVKAIRAPEMPAITQALLDRGVAPEVISQVIGGNSLRFLQRWLPDT